MKSRTTLVLASLTVFLCPSLAEGGIVPEQDNQGPATFNWIPEWKERGDCGRSALFVLMRLEGRDVSLWELKDRIPVDPIHGCSLASLAETAEKLGLPVEVKYVNPRDITRIPRPFILHGISEKKENIGHFIVVVDYDPKEKNLTLIDPVRERLSVNPLDSLLMGYSGYVLLPKKTTGQRWNQLTGAVFFLGGCLLLLSVCANLASKRRSKITHAGTS